MPFAIDNVRIVDLAWIVAGAAGPKVLAGLGAEDLRVEWRGNPDVLRGGGTPIPLGDERDRILAGESLIPTIHGPNQGGGFADCNTGKRSIGLNLRHPRGKALFKELVRISDVVVENFTARTMEGLGLGYEELRKVNPTIIYLQQPGFGKQGLYTDLVSSAPVAEAFSGLTEQSGMPIPYPPAGWGYFFLDVTGSNFCAMALLSALYYRARTGKGQYIDSSLAEPGLALTGTAILDYQANNREYERTGNRSPYRPAAPHGVYRCKGNDRWTAIAVYDDGEWESLVSVLGGPAWARDERFASLGSRILHQDDLDALVDSTTELWDAFELMERLQEAGVAAGVCQTGRDKVERDPQLQHDGFLVDLANRDTGTWPIRDFPVRLSKTPANAGGPLGRLFPSYAQDNDYVYGDLLGLTESDRRELEAGEVI